VVLKFANGGDTMILNLLGEKRSQVHLLVEVPIDIVSTRYVCCVTFYLRY
jgi:hypothetical protein